MKSLKQIFAALALVVASSTASAVPLAVDGGWSIFGWSGLGQASTTYELDVATGAELRVVDCCIFGDEFDIFVDGMFAFSTSAVSPDLDGTPSGAIDGDTAWGTSGLSKGSFFLGAGTYSITIFTTALATGYASGEAFISAVTAKAVPETGTLVLLGLGLIGMGFARRKSA